uniref:Uncharacterized protein n=1 Tax=Callorhinchus milii TaxID=7868 RepID=A0A4W3J636_CALMI
MMNLRARLQSQSLWKLFCTMELRLIPVLAVMENCRIHVNKDGLKRTSKLLEVRQKQLEQEAHRVAGEQFCLASSNQLRQILFDKLRLHLLCEKNLPKTDLRQHQSTSEVVNFVSSTWNQTGTVSGRLSAKHPVSDIHTVAFSLWVTVRYQPLPSK